MKLTNLFVSLASAGLVLASCGQDSLDVFEAPESPYAGAEVLEPATKSINARLDQKYRTVDLTLAELGLNPTDDAVFYAPYDDGAGCRIGSR